MSIAGPTSGRPPIRGPLGVAFSRIYERVIDGRNRAFDAGRGVVHLDRPVISVGNLSVGGTGKTPMVAHLCRVLRGAGHDPCIAMRGYRAGPGGSDEAKVYEREVPGVAVIARPDRVDGLIDLFTTDRGQTVDCIVLDDGFQHRQLARDVDIVLLDATRDPWADRLLPAGWLRESVASLARASAVVVTHAEAVGSVGAMTARAGAAAPGAVVAVCRHEWDCLVRANGEAMPVATLRGLRAAACCAIGNPGPFVRRVEAEAGWALAVSRVLRDHDPYSPATIAALIRDLVAARAECLVVTEKDWAKLADVKPDAWPCPVVRPRLRLAFDAGEAELQRLVVDAARRGRAGRAPDEDAAPGG